MASLLVSRSAASVALQPAQKRSAGDQSFLTHSASSCPVFSRTLGCWHARHRLANRSTLGDKISNTISDLGKGGRVKVINKLYSPPFNKEKINEVLSDDFVMSEDGFTKRFTKADYIKLLCDCVLPAVPDFSWGHASNGEVDRDGYCIVTVQATGHHTGGALMLPGLQPIPASGKHFCLVEEVQKVKVDGSKVSAIQVLPTKGAGPRALYQALGGQLPTSTTSVAPASGATPPMP